MGCHCDGLGEARHCGHGRNVVLHLRVASRISIGGIKSSWPMPVSEGEEVVVYLQIECRSRSRNPWKP